MATVGEKPEHFESRKADHIRLALDPKMQATGLSGLDRIQLIHEAFPELNFEEVYIRVQALFWIHVGKSVVCQLDDGRACR